MTLSTNKPNLNSPSATLLYAISKITKLIETDDKLTTEGEIEVVLFNAYIAKHILYKKKPILFQNIQQEFDKILIEYLLHLGLGKKVPDIDIFLNARAISMEKEVERINSYEGWVPVNIYDWFFVNPLTLNSNPEFDFPKLIMFQMELVNMMDTLKELVDLFIENN